MTVEELLRTVAGVEAAHPTLEVSYTYRHDGFQIEPWKAAPQTAKDTLEQCSRWLETITAELPYEARSGLAYDAGARCMEMYVSETEMERLTHGWLWEKVRERLERGRETERKARALRWPREALGPGEAAVRERLEVLEAQVRAEARTMGAGMWARWARALERHAVTLEQTGDGALRRLADVG